MQNKKDQDRVISDWQDVSQYAQMQRSIWMRKFVEVFEDNHQDLLPELLKHFREIDEKYNAVAEYLKKYD